MNLDSLYHPGPPWIFLHVPSEEELQWLPSFLYRKEGSSPIIRVLRGNKMRSRQGLMDEFGATLQFPEAFGENWHALKEFLSYMDEWLQGDAYILVVTKPLELLSCEPEEMVWLLKVIEEVGEWWSQPVTDNDRFNREAIPFHVVLRSEKGDLDLIHQRFEDVPLLGPGNGSVK